MVHKNRTESPDHCMKNTKKVKNFGLVIDQPVLGDYILGAVGLPAYATSNVLEPTGQWDKYIPVSEVQNLFGVEPSACASFGTLNVVEMLEKRKYGIEHNWSDRWLAWNSGTTQVGNSPHKVCEYLRKGGVPLQMDYPTTPDVNTFEKYYVTPSASLITKAREFTNKYDFKHYYVPPTMEAMKYALKFSPLGCSVSAWATNKDDIYYQFGTDNHWCVIIGFNDERKAWIIFDSYEQNIKLYSYEAKPAIVKGMYLGRPQTGICKWFPNLCG